MDFIYRKTFNRLAPNLFEHDPTLSLLNTSWPKPQTRYEKNNDGNCMDDFWQKDAKFVSNISNLLFSQVPKLQAVVTLKIYITGLDRLWATHFLSFPPFFGF